MHKHIYLPALLLAFLLIAGISSGIAFGQTHHAAKHRTSIPSHKSKLQKHQHPTPKKKFLVTFTCIHCGRKMTLHHPSDWKKTCWVCGCKKPATSCHSKAAH